MNKNLPVDLNDDLHELLLDNEDEDVKVIVQEIHKSPNDLTKWNKLLHHQSITTNEDLLNKSYKKLLSRFPYLESHWIEWSNHEYNFNGLNGKKKILQLAVENFRQSVKLWTEFLRVYLEDTSSVNVDEFRELYKLAISSNGHNFNSHPIWDLIIEYETTNKNSDAVLEIYLQLIKIPLYQYSKYFNDFKTISKEFHLKQIIPSDELADYIKQLSSSEKSEDELSVIDKYQILNTFISTKFNQIQQKVEEFWKYESAIENFDFNIDLINSTTLNNDLKIWNNYIDSVVDQYTKTPDNDELYKIIINLYERCLIPNVYNSQVWLKFIEFINKQGDDEAKFNKINEIYMKINSRIIPIDDNSTRFKYVDYLIEQKKPQQANEYLFDWIKLTSKSNNYHKASYLESIKKLVGIWEEMLSPSQFVKILETLIYNYFNIHSDKHMKTSEEPKEEKEDGDDSTFKLSDSFITSFGNYLKDESVSIIVVEYLTKLQNNDDDNDLKIRQFFNNFNSFNCFNKSVKFWLFYFNFETSRNHLSNLKIIINSIKFKTQLPKIIIDQFIQLHYDYLNNHLIENLKINNGKSDDVIIFKDLHLSNSIFYNKATIKRHTANNYIINDHNRPATDDEFISLSSKHINHPTIFVESMPQITNKVLTSNIDLTKDDLSIPALPLFRNVEKASLPIKYPK